MNIRRYCMKKRVKPYGAFFEGVLLLFVSCGLACALFSFNPHDASWFVFSSDSVSVTNWLGSWGANTAALLFYFMGLAAFVVLVFLFFISFMLIEGKRWIGELDRFGAFFVLMPVVAMLATHYQWHYAKAEVQGGRLGGWLLSNAIIYFDRVGTTMLLWSLVASGLIIIAHHQIIVGFAWIWACVRFMAQQRWILTMAHAFVILMSRLFICPCKYLYALVTGSRISAYARSVVDLEYDISQEEAAALEHVAQRDTWKMNLYDAVQKSEDERNGVQPQETHEKQKEKPSKELVYKNPKLTAAGSNRQEHHDKQQQQELEHKAKLLEEKLSHFDIKGSVVSIKRGPVVTLFEYEPAIGARISKITALEDDLALALQAMSIRIIAPIPGTAVIGFEVSNSVRESVMLSALMQGAELATAGGILPLVLGKDTSGDRVIVDLAKMPHLLIAGSTGSGKSVALHAMIVSLLCTKKPDELKIILIDPKRLEFAAYADIAHLLFPIITNAKMAINGLRFVVTEMERRYEVMKKVGARNITDYRGLMNVHADFEAIPYIVVIIDELSDLMMVGGREIEDLLTRITQMARAAGIHVLVATQRPSVDVITGVIKVNFPSRISFRVTSKVDSRTILDCNGAEKLLGRGDMLFLDAADSSLRRVHGAYVSDQEIATVAHQIRQQRNAAYAALDEQQLEAAQMIDAADEELYREIVAYVRELDEISISLLQRRFRIGFNRSARIIETLEAQGVIAPADGGKMRKVIRQ